MKISAKILKQIRSIPEDTIFGYEQLNISKTEFQAAAKAIERLIKKGLIKKVSKGVFYKPKMTVFGELKPSDTEILRPYLFKGNKRNAYITGAKLYNQLGLTTQMAFRIKIASLNKRIYINAGAIKATPVKSYAEVTDENYQLLGFLDAMKDIKTIPDSDSKTVVAVLTGIIKKLSEKQTKEMIRYALLYPPRVRALLGAILDQLNRKKGITKLKESLNPLSQFKMSIKEAHLKNFYKLEYPMILHKNISLFIDAANITAQQMNIPAIYVEKDYWVTFVIHTIYHNDIGQETVFKGGTALSMINSNS